MDVNGVIAQLTLKLSFSRFENQGEVVDLSQLYVTTWYGRIPVGSRLSIHRIHVGKAISNISRIKCDFTYNQICNRQSWDRFRLICLNPVIGFLWISNFTLSAACWALHSTHSWHGFFVDVTCLLKLPKPRQRLHPVSPVKKNDGAWRPNSLERTHLKMTPFLNLRPDLTSIQNQRCTNSPKTSQNKT